MCINEPSITKLVTLLIEKEFGHKYELFITEICYIDKFLAQAQRETFDLFILLLNNMFYSEVRFRPQPRGVDARLDVIAKLKQSYHRPVIALTGLPDRYTEENTKAAGASFRLVLPLEGEPLLSAVKHCFEDVELARQN
jgi:CheY-like chemotaxis protein